MTDELSVIIPAYNEEKYLPILLNSSLTQDFNGKLQVIVVDGKSEDQTRKVAHSFKNKMSDLQGVISERGIGRQRNFGAKKAKYKYLLFVDADMVLPKRFLSKLFAKPVESKSFIASTLILPADGNFYEWFILVLAYPFILLINFLKPVIPGGLTFTTKELHERIHGYKENLYLGEDIDYGNRAVAAGAKHSIFLQRLHIIPLEEHEKWVL